MIHLLKGILTKEECKFLAQQFDIDKKIKASVDVEKDTGNSYGFLPSIIFDTYLDKLKLKILEIDYNISDLTNVNTYVREYKNNDFLRKHKDRKDISTTMSICLESTINKEWPLSAEINDTEYSFNTNVGDAIVLFDADKIQHWRDTLTCNENERVIQFFLHWVPKHAKKIKTLL